MELILRERGGPVAVTPSDWQSLRLDETIGALERHGILRIERTNAAVLLLPSQFVGELRAPNVKLTVRPKDEALHTAMLSLALRFEGRKTDHYEAGALGKVGDDLATPFFRALVRSLEDGIPWQYEQRTEATSRPSGKTHFAKTIADFVSHGIMHKIVASRHERLQLRGFVNIVWAAYQCLPNTPGTNTDLFRSAAILIESLEPPDKYSIIQAIAEAENFLVHSETSSASAHNLIAASLAVLEKDRGKGRFVIPLPSGTAYFTNLERVWEQVVACLVVETALAINASVAIHGLSASGIRLFGNSGPEINPDVVVRNKSGAVVMLADAKYKVLPGVEPSGIASDVYQLTCYIDRTTARVGVLVYLGMKDSITELGFSQTGGRVVTIRLSAESLSLYRHNALARLLTQHGAAVENA